MTAAEYKTLVLTTLETLSNAATTQADKAWKANEWETASLWQQRLSAYENAWTLILRTPAE